MTTPYTHSSSATVPSVGVHLHSFTSKPASAGQNPLHVISYFRYFGKEAAQIIIKLAAGNGFKKIFVGQNAIMATPAMSAFIRRRKVYGE